MIKKKKKPIFFRLKVDSLQVEIFAPIVVEEQSSSQALKKVPGVSGRRVTSSLPISSPPPVCVPVPVGVSRRQSQGVPDCHTVSNSVDV